MKTNTILIAEVRKNSTWNPDWNNYRHSFVSFDRKTLIEHIEKYYGIELIKHIEDEFPYFTDGGFKFIATDENWIYNVECHPYDIID